MKKITETPFLKRVRGFVFLGNRRFLFTIRKRRRWIMGAGVSRRDFLTYSVATGMLITAGDEMIDSVMAQSNRGVTEVDKLNRMGAGRQLL